MRTIAVTNQKGGCGKTTTAVSLSAALARLGYRTLLVDLDSQSNATLGLGFNPNDFDDTIYEVITAACCYAQAAVINTKEPRLDLLPSNISLAGVEHDLMRMLGKELVLGERLRTLEGQYDFCIIDCAPTVGILSINALVAATDVIVPVQVHFYAIQGLQRLLETVRILNKRFSPCTVELLGLIMTFVDERTSMSKRVQQGMRQYFGQCVFDTSIHASVSLAEAPSHGQSIFSFAPDSRSATEYGNMAQECLKRLEAIGALPHQRSRQTVGA